MKTVSPYRESAKREEQPSTPIECVVSPTYRHELVTNRTLPIYDDDEDPPALRCAHCHSWFVFDEEDEPEPKNRFASVVLLGYALIAGFVFGAAIVTAFLY